MTARPILFSDPLVRAILDGTKTVTRRPVRPQPPSPDALRERYGLPTSAPWQQVIGSELWSYSGSVGIARDIMGCEPKWRCPYGGPGDTLWVREGHAVMCRVADPHCECESDEHHFVEYRADTGNWAPGEWPREAAKDPARPKWKPSIFMRREHSRLTLKVTAVRVERVQEITEEQAKAEGMPPHPDALNWRCRNSFMDAWDSIYAGHTAKPGLDWASNPWVWAVEFEVVS